MGEETAEDIVRITGGEIRQQDKMILKDVTFHLIKGEFVYLIGRTGSGKSSLLKVLYGELPLFAGEGTIAGYKIHTLKKKDIPFLRRQLGVVFQDFQLLYDRTVNENLYFVMKATGWSDRKKIEERAREVLSLVGLGDSGEKQPHKLSGGEQQRVSIARALINRPRFIIADEPTGNLDPETSSEIMEVLIGIVKEGTSVLMATHDISLMEQFPSRTIKVGNQTVLELKPKNQFDPFQQVSFE